jgi:hypothetical protein
VTWVKLDDGFPEHSKILAAGPYGLAVHVRALCWAARNLSDGFIPEAAVAQFTHDIRENRGQNVSRRGVLAGLVRVGLWEEETGGYRIHDYLHFNPSKSEVLAGREKVSGRVKDWRDRKRNATSNTVTRETVTPRVTQLHPGCNAVGNAAPVPVPLPSPYPRKEPISEGDAPGDFSGVRGNGTDPDPAALGPPRRHEATRWPAVLAGLQATLDERDFGVWLADTHELETSALMVEVRTPIFAEEIARRWKGQILALAHEPVVLVSGEMRLILEDESPGVKPAVFTVAENA